jgi:dihydrolipoamide dehydrogenase
VPESQTFDVIVLGAGPVGENAADRANRTGLRVAIVEHELVGGECSYWACMPSKALLRPGQALAAARSVGGAAQAVSGGVDVLATLARRDEFAAHWDDAGQVEWLEGAGITLVRGHGRLAGARTVEVTSGDETVRLVATHAVVLATGSEAVVPDVAVGINPWTSREATSVQEVPESIVVLGGGVVGVEMATAFTDLGSRVTLVHRGARVLEAAEPFASEALAEGLRAIGVDLRLGTEVTSVARSPHAVAVELAGGETLAAEEILVATGRRPRTGDLGLESVGLEPGRPLAVDDQMQVVGAQGGWLFAVGDVTGRVGTTHQGKYEGRVVGDVIAARFGAPPDAPAPDSSTGLRPPADPSAEAGAWSHFRATADLGAQTQVVFTRPEVAWVGLTEAKARAAGREVRVIDVPLTSASGAHLFADDASGQVRLVVDANRDVVIGATFVGPEVAEMLHAATIAVVGEVPLNRLWHAVPAYPTVSEVWLRLLEAAGL